MTTLALLFLIHVIIESVTTASKGSEKTSVQTFPVRGLDMLEGIDKGARLPG